MTVVGIAMVKDEADVVEATMTHMAGQVDHLLVADNMSTDGTREILDGLAEGGMPLTVLEDREVGYFQSAKMSKLAALAGSGDYGLFRARADWVVPFDCDELWVSSQGRIADVLTDCPASIAVAALYDHRCTAADPDDGNPFVRMGWREAEAAPLHKVACRPTLPVTIEQGNHGARYNGVQETTDGLLTVHHYPIRSPEQMIRKARNGGRAYAGTGLPEHMGAHWRDWDKLSDDQLRDVFREHYFRESTDGMVYECPLS